ncbi:fimbrial protein BcfF [Serratia proteamaculans]|uniref:fimbrial protein n=1 Tax=Serratia proteamaculans TaxID=28151 RepID=UPI002179025C|nr:fimbrial protein [Serratia proteamaculans]CAI0940643.1 fimbrial protein BcfF [Serratia proteamaculans]CAI1739382.1 fimbrial protein BcfF [Serratia proteamaculans]
MPLFNSLTRRGLLPLLLLVSTGALADSATVNITGRILSSACEPEVNPLTVPLGNISRTALDAKGATASATAFQLRLKNCPAEISQIKVQFDGTPASGDSNALALTTAPGVATGVAVQLQDASGTLLPPGQPSALMAIKGGSGTVNSLAFSARYIATSDSVTAGNADASATFTLWYSN